MLLKMLLFDYNRKAYSGRKIVQINEENIPMKWLTHDTAVSYKTLNNFRASHDVDELIKIAFVYFTELLSENGLLQNEALFIDGTKIEADANKYSFTWKRAVNKFHPKLRGQITKLYEELIETHVVAEMEQEYVTSSEGLTEVLAAVIDEIQDLTQKVAAEPKVIKGGSPNKQARRMLKKAAHKIETDYLPRAQKYEKAEKFSLVETAFLKLITMQLSCE